MIKKITTHPITFVAAAVLGIVLGKWYPNVITFATPVKTIYTALLNSCAFPLLLTVLVTGIGKLYHEGGRSFIRKYLFSMILCGLMAALIGIGVSFLLSDVMVPSDEMRLELIVNQTETDSYIGDSFSHLNLLGNNTVKNKENYTLNDFLPEIIPSNIFEALAKNHVLQSTCFFLMFGIMLHFVDAKYSRPLIMAFEGITKTLGSFTERLRYFLPIVLMITMSGFVTNVGLRNLAIIISGYLVSLGAAFALMWLVCAITIRIKVKIPILKQLFAIKNTFITAISTSEKMIIFPASVNDAVDNFGLDEETTGVVLATSSAIYSTAAAIYTAVSTFFAIYIYEKNITLPSVVITLLMSWFMGFAAGSMNISQTVDAIGATFRPLGIPIDLMGGVYTSSYQLYGGLFQFTNAYANIAIDAICMPKGYVPVSGETLEDVDNDTADRIKQDSYKE